MEVSNQIRKHRDRLGLSQEALAEAIFVSRQTVSNWETDKTYPDVQSLVLLSKTFGVSVDELVKGDVAVMRRAMEEDSKKMNWLAWVMVGGIVLGIAFLAALSFAWRDPSGIGDLTKGNVAGAGVFMPLYAISMGAAVVVDRIKKRNDVTTYREIEAFMQGKVGSDLERSALAFSRKHPALSAVAKFACAAVLGAVIGLLLCALS